MKTTFTSIGTGNTTKDNTISQHQCSVSVKDDTFHLIGEQLVSGVGTLSNLPSFVSNAREWKGRPSQMLCPGVLLGILNIFFSCVSILNEMWKLHSEFHPNSWALQILYGIQVAFCQVARWSCMEFRWPLQSTLCQIKFPSALDAFMQMQVQ